MYKNFFKKTTAIGMFLFCFFIVVLSACQFLSVTIGKKENVNDIQCNTTGWNPDNIRYSNTVSVIISKNCFGCHSNSTKKMWVTLEGYDHLKKYVNNHKLLGVIGHLKGYVRMPKHASQLPQDEICKIKFWIDNGALNN